MANELDEKFQTNPFVGTITLIKPMKYGDMPNTMEMQKRYDVWMSGGAKPDIQGSPVNFMSTQFHIAIYRPINGDNLRKIKLRAWTNMPIFFGDIIETGPYLRTTISFTNGGIAVVKNSALVQILNREIQDLNYGNKDRLMKIIDKFIINHASDPLQVNFEGGYGIKDDHKLNYKSPPPNIPYIDFQNKGTLRG